MHIRKNVLAQAVNAFKLVMMTSLCDDFEEEILYAEVARRSTIYDYDLSVAEAAAFHREIGYTPPIN